MKYIIENIVTNYYGDEQINSYLIEKNKVIYSSNYFSKYKYMRLNTTDYVLTPGYQMIDFSVISINNFQNFKERMKYLQTIGCTSIITACHVRSEVHFLEELKRAKHALNNSSIDYLIGIKIPLLKLTPTLVRKCCKHKVPIIFTEINDPNEIYTIQWQWIRNELLPYQVMIVPIWNVSAQTRTLNKMKNEWEEQLTINKITTQLETPKEHTPLNKPFLLNIGIYPNKGSMQTGTAADYLLFSKQKLKEAAGDFRNLAPEIVYANGQVKKAGSNVFLKPGCGQEIVVNIPKKFNSIYNAFQPISICVD